MNLYLVLLHKYVTVLYAKFKKFITTYNYINKSVCPFDSESFPRSFLPPFLFFRESCFSLYSINVFLGKTCQKED